jgi:parvulin-like peptidyl-prolyl isomerase
VGGVVAEVNRTPIYAEKVVNELVHALAAQAKRLDERSFREAALKLLRDQREVMIREELQFAAAEQMLGSEDKNLAKLVTENWRQRKITEAGGSVELARQKAASEGRDFEQMVQDEHRHCMIDIYQQKKVWPRVQVTIEDMRRHYDHNIADFTKKSRAQFRLIKIDPKQAGSREEALRKIKLLYERAAGGWDFAKLAGETNDDPELKRKGGDVGLIQEGAYKLDQIAQAIWKLRIGEITDIIDTGDAFWIAKLESFEAGEIHPFEEEDVQVEIRRRLTAQQFAALREQVVKDLKAAASVREDEELLNAPLEMIMQNYPRWAVQK